jgi:hypothetical protein
MARRVQHNELALPCYSRLGVVNAAVELIAHGPVPLVWEFLCRGRALKMEALSSDALRPAKRETKGTIRRFSRQIVW